MFYLYCNMIGNYRPAATTSIALVVCVIVLIFIDDAAHRGSVSAFASVRSRRPPNAMAMSPTTTKLRAATIDASEVYHGSFFVGGCAAGNDDEDCLLFEGGGGVAASSLASSSSSSSSSPSDGAVAGDLCGTTAAFPRPPARVVSNNGRGGAAALLAATIAVAVARGGGARTSALRRLASSSWARYLSMLGAHPLPTKCVTGGVIALVGDYLAQWFEYSSSSSSRRRRASSSSSPPPSSSEYASSPGDGCPDDDRSRRAPRGPNVGPLSIHGTYVARRGVARFLECLLISSPLMHVGYDFFERVMPISSSGVASTGMYRSLAALSHAVADSVFLDGIFVCTGIVATGLFEGHSLRRRVLPNLKALYLPTLRASVVTSSALMPLQFLSFRFLPVQLRVLSVNAVDLVWTAVVSFVSHGGGGDGCGEDLVTAEG